MIAACVASASPSATLCVTSTSVAPDCDSDCSSRVSAAALTRLLQSLSQSGATLVLVTHNVAEGLALATHAAIMRDGRFARFDHRAERNGFDAGRYAAE